VRHGHGRAESSTDGYLRRVCSEGVGTRFDSAEGVERDFPPRLESAGEDGRMKANGVRCAENEGEAGVTGREATVRLGLGLGLGLGVGTEPAPAIGLGSCRDSC
jgi:hypothetical protein